MIDWHTMLVPDTPLLEIVIRGSTIYLSVFLLLRLVLKRQAGAVGITDMLVVVLIADAAQNGMADDYHAIPDGVLLVGVIVFWAFFLDFLGYYVPAIHRLVHPPALRLVENGRLLRHNMRKEFITEDELLSQLREQGVDRLEQVREAFMEGNGRISVLQQEPSNGQQQPQRERTPGG